MDNSNGKQLNKKLVSDFPIVPTVASVVSVVFVLFVIVIVVIWQRRLSSKERANSGRRGVLKSLSGTVNYDRTASFSV